MAMLIRIRMLTRFLDRFCLVNPSTFGLSNVDIKTLLGFVFLVNKFVVIVAFIDVLILTFPFLYCVTLFPVTKVSATVETAECMPRTIDISDPRTPTGAIGTTQARCGR